MQTLTINLPTPHSEQARFIRSTAKRKILRAGRRGGKTVGVSIYAVERFLLGKRVLYTTPTSEQIDRFWTEVNKALIEPIDAGVFLKNETKHTIELPNSEQRIRAKTAWNADTLRGDYGDELIFDEYQLMDETAWSEVGAPMLLDNDGNATFIYTPPSLQSRSASKARDPQHAAKLFKKALADTSGRWETFAFASDKNPHISKVALSEISKDMTSLAYRQEILAEDVDEAPGALWKRSDIDTNRVVKAPESLDRVVVGVDPTATSGGDEAGIITEGKRGDDYYCLADDSTQGSPETWARAAITAFFRSHADCIVAEKNNGGEMVESVIRQAVINAKAAGEKIGEVPVRLVWASRGKATRAEPISAMSENDEKTNRKGRDHHVGVFALLEDELCQWVPGDPSPNRLDAKVWAMTELSNSGEMEVTDNFLYN
jgi:hypothetical protein